MADAIISVFDSFADSESKENSPPIKLGLAKALQGGVIVEVTNAEQAKIAEEAGASCIVIYPGRFRTRDLSHACQIKQAVSIPVMARVRIGHFVEAQILEAVGVDYIDESELLGNADNENYINKHNFRIPFACGCSNFNDALARITEGAVILWIQGEVSRWNLPGFNDIAETVRNVRSMMKETRNLTNTNEDEVFSFTKKVIASYGLAAEIKRMGKLPAMQIASGGIKTPADAALMMQLGCDGVLVRLEIFRSEAYISDFFYSSNPYRPDILYSSNPYKRIRAIVQAVKHYNNPSILAECSYGLDDTIAEDDYSVEG
ncbi:hypothetical protein GH714_034821 [Hevea brasiliensis]|uniref:PdxS/SNZ N-terminal domain-containing protein n=1 Tax=Hevea brasiliensis TaxID=3981 RepID=A0A6A6NDQ9_HEVBR|nr:hypothetical protein GH714_034821 [Hevea brasiliensis]